MIIQFSNSTYGVVTDIYYSYSTNKYFVYYWSPMKYEEPGDWDYGSVTEWGLENYKPTILGNLTVLNTEEVIREEIEGNI